MFNIQQMKAINSKNNTVVLAGAGSGKTAVFIEKIKHIINNNKDIRENILALTFTEKASNEFKNRLEEDLKYMGTFHSVFYKLLNSVIDTKEYKILSEDSYKTYLENNYDVVNEKQFALKIGNMINLDNYINNNLDIVLKATSLENYYELLTIAIEKDFYYIDKENLIKDFFEQKTKDKVLSFSDIIFKTYFSLLDNIDFYNELKNKFKYILVDEFQDNNFLINHIVKMISNDNLFMVGDIYQSIYSFNHSKFTDTVKLIKDIDNFIQLDINYRSSQNIVDFSNYIITDIFKDRLEKIENVEDFGKVENKNISIVENINDFTIATIIKNSNDNLEDIAILSRNNNHLVEIKDILKKYNIPFNEKPKDELERLIYSLVLASESDYILDNEYFNRFNFDMSDFKISKDSEELIKNLRRIIKKYSIDKYFINKDIDFIKQYKKLEYELIQYYISNDFESVLNNFKRLISIFLDNKDYLEKKGVNVMTIHKSKGLEFNTVILYNLEDKIFPRNPNIEEEKRVFYVAVTRAKSNLFLTSKKYINEWVKKAASNLDFITPMKNSNKKINFDFEYRYIDKIDFQGDPIKLEELKFFKYKDKIVNENYTVNNNKIVLNNFYKYANSVIQNETLKNLNNITIDDIELVLFDIREFLNDNEIDNIELKEKINCLEKDANKFLFNGAINLSFLNEVFSTGVHEILNYKNWVLEDNQINEIEIKRFKKIVKNIISKKYTNITKDKNKKLLEIEERVIANDLYNKKLEDYDDFIDYMNKLYFEKSEKEKKFFIENIVSLYDIKNKEFVIDFHDEKYANLLEDMRKDFKYNEETNDYDFIGESIPGAFISNRKSLLAHKRQAKLKYLEYMSMENKFRNWFITFTLPTTWHRYRLNSAAISNKNLRKYGDSNILEENPNFEMIGFNFKEHIINSAKEINQVWNYFYHIVKVELNNLKRKNKKLVKKKKMTKKEFKSFNYDYTNYFKVLEPHKNLTAHTHISFFIDDNLSHIIDSAYNKSIEKFGLNKEYCDIKKILNLRDTEAGELQYQINILNDKIGLLKADNKHIEEIKNLRDRIKNFNIDSNSFLMFVDTESKSELKIQLKKYLKKNRIDYIKLKKLEKELVLAKNNLSDYLSENGYKALLIRNEIETAQGEERTLLEKELKSLEFNLKTNFASPSSYVFKYMFKNIKSEDENEEEEEIDFSLEIEFYNAWESLIGNKAKIVVMSNFKDSTQLELNKLYNFMNKFAPNKLEEMKEQNIPLYVYLENIKTNNEAIFTYDRRVKENFDNSAFLERVKEEFVILNELDSSNYSNNWFKAINIILNSGESFLNIQTNKKLVDARIMLSLVKSSVKSRDEIKDMFLEKNIENEYYLDSDANFETEYFFKDLYKNREDNYIIMYIEDMYKFGNSTIKDVFETILHSTDRYKNLDSLKKSEIREHFKKSFILKEDIYNSTMLQMFGHIEEQTDIYDTSINEELVLYDENILFKHFTSDGKVIYDHEPF